jgi:hypothetical protein
MISSKIIRQYLLLWCAVVVGLVIFIIFVKTNKYLTFVGLLTGGFGFLYAVVNNPPVQGEIKRLYPIAAIEERVKLKLVFYFARSIYLIFGLAIIVGSFFLKGNSSQKLTEITGDISSLEINKDTVSFNLVGNPNEYRIDRWIIPSEKIEMMIGDFRDGGEVSLLIPEDVEAGEDKPYISVYGIRSENNEYLTRQQYTQEMVGNRKLGFLSGIVISAIGLIYLVSGRVQTNEYEHRRDD